MSWFSVYWDLSGDPPGFNGLSFEQWQQRGHDESSLVADPLFVRRDFSDRQSRPLSPKDFLLRENSPAQELGFEPWELDRTGLYGSPEWVSLPQMIERPQMTFAQYEPIREIIDDFESYSPGERPENASTTGLGSGADIAVTRAASAEGSKSLHFVDAPDLPQRWHPHLYYTLDLRDHRAGSEFDLLLKEGAELFVEWRNGANPYRTGPRITIAPDGGLRASDGEVLMHLPHDTWIHVDLLASLGPASDATYDMIVTLPGESPQRFEKLPFPDADFRSFQWFGISGMATDKAEFHLDNLEIRPRQ